MNGSVTLSDIDPMLPAIVEKTFSCITGVTLREPKSYRTVIERWPDLKSKVFLAPDSAFYEIYANDDAPINEIDLPDNYFCFSTSMMPIDFNENKENSSLVNLLLDLSSRFGTPVILARDIEDQFLNSLSKYLDCVVIGKRFSCEDVIEIIKGGQFLLSGRYHHLIFSYLSGTPFIALDTTSHKIKGLVELAIKNPIRNVFDPTNLKNCSGDIIKSALSLMDLDIERRKSIRDDAQKLGCQFSDVTNRVFNS